MSGDYLYPRAQGREVCQRLHGDCHCARRGDGPCDALLEVLWRGEDQGRDPVEVERERISQQRPPLKLRPGTGAGGTLDWAD